MMKNSRVCAFFCWLFSAMVFLGATFGCKGVYTVEIIMDYLLAVAMLIVGFVHWKNREPVES